MAQNRPEEKLAAAVRRGNRMPTAIPASRALMKRLGCRSCRRYKRSPPDPRHIPGGFFDDGFVEPRVLLRMLRYPVIDGQDETLPLWSRDRPESARLANLRAPTKVF